MPEELHEAPVNMTPRNENRVPEMLIRSVDRKNEILQSGRIEQLEAENEMLQDQLKSAGRSSAAN